jgi:penicillin amidase/acyl-homoserine-lactone acylase
VNRLRRGSFDLPLGGAPDTLRAVYSGEPGADGKLTAQAGDTLVMFVEWDREGRVRSDSVHPFGSATVDAGSPHYADQAPLYAGERTKRVRLDLADLRAHLEREYRPGDEDAARDRAAANP